MFTRYLIIGVLTLALAVPVLAQDEPPPSPWSFEAEFSLVSATGNQETMTYGLGTKLGYARDKSAVLVEAGGILQESSVITRTAAGDSSSYTVQESKTTDRTAEAYYARGRYDYKVSDKMFFLAGVDWLRNTFAGIDSRTLLSAGAGRTWVENEKVKFLTTASATYTFQQDVVENPFVKTDFAGLRATYEFWTQITESTEFKSELTADFNLDNSDDVRLNFYNAMPISVSSKIAFKPSLRLLWRNQPSLTTVALSPGPGTVAVPLDKLDAFGAVSLIVKI